MTRFLEAAAFVAGVAVALFNWPLFPIGLTVVMIAVGVVFLT